MIQDRADYKDAWELPETKAEDKPDEFELKGVSEENTLADKLAAGEGEKHAAGDGVSFQIHRAMRESGVGPYGAQQPTAEQKETRATGTPIRADQTHRHPGTGQPLTESKHKKLVEALRRR